MLSQRSLPRLLPVATACCRQTDMDKLDAIFVAVGELRPGLVLKLLRRWGQNGSTGQTVSCC